MFKALENRMWVTSSFLRHENKTILILKILSQTEVPQNARCLSAKYHGCLMPLENNHILHVYRTISTEYTFCFLKGPKNA